MLFDTVAHYAAYILISVCFGIFVPYLIAFPILYNFEFKSGVKLLVVISFLVSILTFRNLVTAPEKLEEEMSVSATEEHPEIYTSPSSESNGLYAPPPTFEPLVIPTIDESAFSIPESDAHTITFVTAPSSVYPGTRPTVKIKGKPYTTYDISVIYSSGPSKASGLDPKQSNAEGYVTWSWKVGTNTYSGSYPIIVTGGGQEAKIYFEVLP